MAKNSSLENARNAKKDEFYTQLTDIENELRHYRPHFKGKTVLCNCDDPYESNFFKYFALNFNKLKLKKLVATCYSGSPIAGTQLSLFGDESDEGRRTPYKAVVTTVHDTSGEGGIDMLDVAELFRTGENLPLAGWQQDVVRPEHPLGGQEVQRPRFVSVERLRVRC